MFCYKCSANNSEQAHYCYSCGAKLVGNGQETVPDSSSNSAAKNSEVSKSEYYEAAIGYKNTDFYLARFSRFDSQVSSVSWNWPSFFISFYWLLYRKMWGWALLYFLLPIPITFFMGILSSFSDTAVSLFYLAWMVGIFILFPMYANAIYYRHVNKKILKAKNFSDDKEKRLRMIIAEGGTSGTALIVILIFVFIAIIGILAAVAIPAYQDYTVRATVAEGLNLAETAKTAVVEYTIREQQWPSNNTVVGVTKDINNPYVDSLVVDKGVIYVSMAPDSGASGKLVFVPSYSEGIITWSCNESTVERKYLPAICR